ALPSDVRDQRVGAHPAAEEDLEEKRAARRHIVDRLLQPDGERVFTTLRYPVDLLVRETRLSDVLRRRVPALDEPGEDGIDLTLRRRPDVADPPLDRLLQVVAGALPAGEEAEDRELRRRERHADSILVCSGLVHSGLALPGEPGEQRDGTDRRGDAERLQP